MKVKFTPIMNMQLKSILVNLILITSLLFFNSYVYGQLSESNYKIYSVKLQKETNLSEIVNEMQHYDVLLYGEEHNDSVTHFLQSEIFKLLHKKYESKLSLSMEMFDRDVQTVMNEYLKNLIRESNFIKDSRAWSNYINYRDMVEYAKLNKLDVICANAPRRYTNLAGRKGQSALLSLSKKAKNYIAPLPYEAASGKYYDKLMALSSHDPGPAKDTSAKKSPPVASMGGFNLIDAQSLWDATMAYSISKYLKKHKGKKVLQLNGRFHSDEGFAIATQLKKYRPKTKYLIISSGSDELFPNIDWEKYKHLGDYLIITDPAIPKTY